MKELKICVELKKLLLEHGYTLKEVSFKGNEITIGARLENGKTA